MANDTITVTYKVLEDGSLKRIAKGADKAAASTNKASTASDRYSKKNKGVAQAGMNSTKAFSKMSTGITGGLVPAYAILAANVFALTAAFGLLARNDAISKLAEGLEYTGNAAGKNLGMVADKLKEITDNAISAEAAMRAVAVGVSAGFSEGQLEDLTRVAKGASLALGRDMGDAMDRLIRGSAKLEPEILDELGIMVRLDDATRKYADSVDKTVSELTQFERRMAFTNAVIEDGISKFQDIAAELDASPYSQLSASFADLTKSGVALLNNVLTPIISFLANNMAALAAVMALFAMSISKTLISSLSEMAEASAEAGKQAANMAKIHIKALKPADHMGEAFNRIAGTMGDAKMELKDYNKNLETMQKSAMLTVNMMGRENPLLKEAIKTRGQLTRAVHLGKMAIHKESAAKALNMIQTHGLSAAYVEHRVVMTAAAADTARLAAGQDLYTQAIIRGRGALFALGASAKFAGAALLTAMPWIMGILAVVSIVGPLITGLFSEKEDRLSKQLEKNTERWEKFGDVVAQYNRSIEKATDAADAWHRAIKPLAGLFDQVSTALSNTQLEAETDRIIAHAAAVRDLKHEMSPEAKVGWKNRITGGFWSQYWISEAKARVEATKEMSAGDITIVNLEAEKGISSLLAHLDQMIEKTTELSKTDAAAGKALAILTKSREEAKGVLDTLMAIKPEERTEESAKAAQKGIDDIGTGLTVALKAYEEFGDILAKAQVLTSTKTFGEFAKEIDNVTEANKNLAAMTDKLGFDAAEAKAKQVMEEFGITQEAILNYTKTWGAMLNETTGPKAKTAVQSLKDFEEALRNLNLEVKEYIHAASRLESLTTILGEDNTYVHSQIVKLAKKALELAKQKLDLIVKGGDKEHDQKLEVVKMERELLALTIKRMDVLAGKAKDVGMGGAASAALGGAGAIAAIDAATVGTGDDDTFATKDDKKAAMAAAVAEQAKGILGGVAEDLKKIGPEGELLSATIQGALDMSSAWSTAFEVMGTDGISMATKVQVGLGAVGATVSALGAMQSAASDQRIRNIDNEIQQEKNRDGQSAASLAKISQLEKKKEQEKKKAFEQEKKMKIAMTIISTAQGAMAAYSSMAGIPYVGPALGALAAAMVIKMGADQLSAIQSSTFAGGGSLGGAPSKVSMGSRSNTVDLAKGNNAGGELAYMRGESGQGTGATNFRPGFVGVRHRAGGGYVVGEQGPEIFMPDVPGQIMSAGESQNAGGSTITANINIQALDAAGVQDVIIGQKGNIISMIRDAANEHGEFFMEGINTDVYSNAQEAM